MARSAARAPRTRLDKDERQSRLLELGLRAFSSCPYDELSIDDIAKEAGISKGLLYHYFPTKRDFYVATVREAARKLKEETMTSPELAPLARLDKGLHAYLDFAERHEKAYVGLMRGGIGADPEVAAVVEETREELTLRIMNDAPVPAPRDRERLRLALRGWIGFVEATAIEWLERRGVSRKALVELWTRVLFTVAPASEP